MVGSLKLKEILDTELPNTCPRSDTSEPPQPGIGSSHPPEDDWVISINKSLEKACQDNAARPWRKVSIYRVPHCLRDSKHEKAYIPQVVSLGPYHHGETVLQPMERHKWRALQNILKRKNQNVELYLDSMKELEERARACYEERLELSSNKFAEMMVLDGCFVLELFHGYAYGFEKLGYAWNDPVFSERGAITLIVLDMMMLENQIPLIVLGKLFELQLPDHIKDRSEHQVAWLAIQFLDSPLLQTGRDCKKYDPKSDEVGLHCLDVFRKYLLSKGPDNVQSSTRDSTTSDPLSAKVDLHCLCVKCLLYIGPDNPKKPRRQIYSATDLKDAGIKFREHTSTYRLWDIQFNNGVLYIPPILIDDGTESLLRNLIAFEQCHLDCKKDITDYVVFLDNLINSEEDVRYLRRHKIIDNCLGSDLELANLVNSLCQEVTCGDRYSKLYEELNEHYDRKWNIWRATLKQKYFSNPWAILSLVAAVVLLLMTAAQTFYTVYPYYLPRK